MEVFETLDQIPDEYVLVVSHFAPWWEPLRSWIADGRPWIEIEYGYWGPADPKGRRATRRVTYCGHHNLKIAPRPWNRSQLFDQPATRPWQQNSGNCVVAVMPQSDILLQRTNQTIDEWKSHAESVIRTHWQGDIVWRPKTGSKHLRWQKFCQELEQAHAVVGERTMACVEAVMMGVPAYTLDDSMVTLIMGSVENLSSPQQPDRSDWWDHVCWSQFHAKEFETQTPALLTEWYQITGMDEIYDISHQSGLQDHSNELLLIHESTEYD
jgi:hypothetical protein